MYLLRINISRTAYNISYNTWNYLSFGKSAIDNPQQGGGIKIEYKTVHPSNYKCLLDDSKLPLSAVITIDYIASCIA